MTVLCKCGCGDPAPVIVKNNTARGYVAGEHHEYIRNHRKRKRTYVHFKFCNDCRQLKHKNAFTDCISSRDGKHIDHIVPLSRGGLHCYANVQVAHSRCNLRKRNKIELDTVRS
jgi:5-methylcytosine-specific restriction endonuclease McrA